jgi:Tol biopolymer transport system component
LALPPGTRLGIFEITAKIGEGGMGQVYRATDTRLKREVAIKILPPSLAADRERLTRFQREAEVLASLNHPNIAAIYGIEETGDVFALVMELVEGEDLSQRIARGAIPLDEALPFARQIAEALEAAHEQGIIHRDLKPANIKVRADGTVKVLDFGLAKPMGPAAGSRSGVSTLPTITSPEMTRAGAILGTVAYMSPEQAKGRIVDKRTDVWAFGAVLFEMLTGSQAFVGDGMSDTLANILKSEPDWTRLPADVSPRVRLALRACLQKDQKQRMADVQSVRLALDGAFETAAPLATAPTPEPRSRARVFVAVAVSGLAGALVAAAALWSTAGRAPASETPIRTSVVLPANRPVSMVGAPTRALALSPDGTQLVYVGTNLDAPVDQPGGREQLHLRSLGTLAVRDLPATLGANQPFFSPDGQWVGFFTGDNASGAGALKKIALAGGNPITLVEKINGSAASFGVWAEDGTIIFGTISSGLRRVSAEGGAATALTTLDAAKGEQWHSFPALTPSSRAVLFTVRSSPGLTFGIDAVMLATGARRVVLENARMPFVMRSGHLLFQRDEAILNAPFDLERLTVTGPAVPLVDAVRRDSLTASAFPVAVLAVSQSGTLGYLPDTDTATALGMVRQDGGFEPLGPPPANFNLPRMSLDGHSVAFIVHRGQDSEVHVYDRLRGGITKLTQDEFDVGLAWHPDGRSLAIAARKKDVAGIFLKHLDGRERLLVATPPGATYLRNVAWSPDGTRLAYTVQTGLLHDIWVLTMGEPPTTQPFLTSAASEYSPTFSPDGRWLAYQSDESGRFEVYVQAYPKGERIAVSTGGGNGPVWRRDGKALFFEGLSGGIPKMMAVAVAPDGATLQLGQPMPLFDLRAPGPTGAIMQYSHSTNIGAKYDILPDGRFLMIRGPDPTGTREIVLVQHWFDELKRLVPTK